jgi:plastocyanin
MGTFNILSPNPFYLESVFHTVTSCKSPCNLNYGIAYPIADGNAKFDSGELGMGLPGVGRLTWKTPANLPPGTYTFFCRIHPWMRGVFRIIQ